MSVAHRLGIPHEHVHQIDLLATPVLPPADKLFAEAFRLGEQDPKAAQTLLAAALLSCAQHTHSGRLAGALALIAQLVARANPYKTLGPEGKQLRADLLPTGWTGMAQSWEHTRYAWREGLQDLLDVQPEDKGSVEALNEITRLSPAEPEPVRVAIQEQWPAPKVAFLISGIGLALTLRAAIKDYRQSRRRRP